MKFLFFLFLPALSFAQMNSTSYPVYNKADLGVLYKPVSTLFKVWAPAASALQILLYKTGAGGGAFYAIDMVQQPLGIWQAEIKRNLKNIYYTFKIMQEGNWMEETPDIFAKAAGVNGKRGMIVDMSETNPAGWKKDKGPLVKHFTDIIIYESHIRDISISNNSGIKNKGKFLGLTEANTKSMDGLSTGLAHLKELGITHIHLLPSFDFNSIDETKSELNKYNWGYDPLNYNVPEGSYSTDAYDGRVRIKEFKQLVQALHSNGIGVIMDVVYNHTASKESTFNKFAPGYFYRHHANGKYSDATGCGNETASEMPMMRQFMIASVVYWATEYHIDGFRFDLMGVHDIETMNEISDTLHKINPSIFIYGEGWTAGASPLPEDLRAVKKNTYLLKEIAAFSDDIRDGLRGPYDKLKQKGFVSGAADATESVKFGIVGATQHSQIIYTAVNHSQAPWAASPAQSINYVSCHDDNTMFDRLTINNPGASESDLIKMDKLAQCVVLTSQGVPFIQSGAEMLRTKQGAANSYNSPDSINEIDWSRKLKYKDVFDYYRLLIALRKHHPAFRMATAKMIQEHLKFIETGDPLLINYTITGNANGDKWKEILVFFNGNAVTKTVALPAGKWTVAVDGSKLNEKGIKQAEYSTQVTGTGALILFR